MKTTMKRYALVFASLMLSAAGAQAAGMLTSTDDMTLYIFDKDKDGMSSCYGECAVEWPAYLGKDGDTLKEGWTLVKRTDGTMQWAHDGKPVYFFKNDKKQGDMAGDGHDGVWHIVLM